jgi:hypothetical protein
MLSPRPIVVGFAKWHWMTIPVMKKIAGLTKPATTKRCPSRTFSVLTKEGSARARLMNGRGAGLLMNRTAEWNRLHNTYQEEEV